MKRAKEWRKRGEIKVKVIKVACLLRYQTIEKIKHCLFHHRGKCALLCWVCVHARVCIEVFKDIQGYRVPYVKLKLTSWKL